MIITFKDGSKKEMPLLVHLMTGYVATSFELGAKDVNYLVELYKRNPREFEAMLFQWQARFPENRVGG